RRNRLTETLLDFDIDERTNERKKERFPIFLEYSPSFALISGRFHSTAHLRSPAFPSGSRSTIHHHNSFLAPGENVRGDPFGRLSMFVPMVGPAGRDFTVGTGTSTMSEFRNYSTQLIVTKERRVGK
ncbi:hypothetical protein ALC56_12404, partial [Trachymyrmex septentrionalis]